MVQVRRGQHHTSRPPGYVSRQSLRSGQAPNRPILTTQLYFPGEPRNRTDRIFKADLLLAVQDTADGKSATFDFILDMA